MSKDPRFELDDWYQGEKEKLKNRYRAECRERAKKGGPESANVTDLAEAHVERLEKLRQTYERRMRILHDSPM